jgi:hypothetical protein
VKERQRDRETEISFLCTYVRCTSVSAAASMTVISVFRGSDHPIVRDREIMRERESERERSIEIERGIQISYRDRERELERGRERERERERESDIRDICMYRDSETYIESERKKYTLSVR